MHFFQIENIQIMGHAAWPTLNIGYANNVNKINFFTI